jgi:hypothetical protein
MKADVIQQTVQDALDNYDFESVVGEVIENYDFGNSALFAIVVGDLIRDHFGELFRQHVNQSFWRLSVDYERQVKDELTKALDSSKTILEEGGKI